MMDWTIFENYAQTWLSWYHKNKVFVVYCYSLVLANFTYIIQGYFIVSETNTLLKESWIMAKTRKGQQTICITDGIHYTLAYCSL